MRVRLISHTPDALELLLYTKNTRLNMQELTLADIKAWPEEKKAQELAYMMGTVKSSWEFVDYVFQIDDVTRAFTHQLVRHRAGTAFAQQAQRVVDMSDFTYEATGSLTKAQDPQDQRRHIYAAGMESIKKHYRDLIAAGTKIQDARGILPTNVHTSITFKANLRTIHTMCLERLCIRAQGEFQDVMRAIREEIIKVHPWTDPMLRVHCAVTGTCCFPNHVGCPIKPVVYNPKTGDRFEGDGGKPWTLSDIHDLWRNLRMEIQPNAPK